MNAYIYFYVERDTIPTAINDGGSGFFVLFADKPDPEGKFITPGSEP